MDWHLLGLSFITVFLAELGDKSQLAAIALSGRSQSPRAVFCWGSWSAVDDKFTGSASGRGSSSVFANSSNESSCCCGICHTWRKTTVAQG